LTGAETAAAVPRVGRIMVGPERAAREESEAARDVPGEVRRTAFAISGSHLLTAWHCVRDAVDDGAPLWFRLRREPAIGRRYVYVPVRVTNYDHVFDVAALAAVPPEPALSADLAASSEINARTVSLESARLLRESGSEYADAKLGPLVGWTHFLHESQAGARPTAVGTAYGLKLALLLDEQDGRLDRAALAETLWKLRLPDGSGWSARTGSGISRPEITALVLGALSQAGCDQARLAAAADAFEVSLSPEADFEGMQHTYVVTAAMRGLMRIRPGSRRLVELRKALLSGAVQDPEHENLICWSGRFEVKRSQSLVPSAAHTGMAVVALVRAGQVLGDEQGQAAIGQAVGWLAAHRELANVTEQIRRIVTEYHWDSLTVKHFTAAWVARALLAASPSGQPEADVALTAAVRKVWRAQRDGAWEWDDRDRPLWMMYQGAAVMREYALRVCPPL